MKISEYSIEELKDEIARRKHIDKIKISKTNSEIEKKYKKELNELRKELKELHNGIKYKVMIGDFEVIFYVGWEALFDCTIFDISSINIVYKGKQTEQNKIIVNAFQYYFETMNVYEIEHFLNLEEVKKAQKEINKRIKSIIKKSDAIAKQNNIDINYFWHKFINKPITK